MDLIQAVILGDVNKVKKLLEQGANVNLRDRNGMTALMLAVRKGQISVVKLLLEKEADVNTQDDFMGWTALILASALGYTNIVKLLLENGADVDIKDKNGMTALKYAMKNGHEEIVKLIKTVQAKTKT
ncbi:MAG TPA: ankyrin repeat domain-containing protein [Candidatus Desulfofervidus auxilii]|uniref:Ankyrin repeat domain-containing protein n=1 Tax=Desulfofervidus auxilii TaxID=1621989 RepID=A0A7V1I555_DESA2|nr:ankyrin repeat domain-containing protein [Candidatus Desulfofervidus auxilii]